MPTNEKPAASQPRIETSVTGSFDSKHLNNAELLKLCRQRSIVNCRHFHGWKFEPHVRDSDYEARMDHDGDTFLDLESEFVSESVSPVNVIIRPDTSRDEAVRLIRKIADQIATLDAKFLERSAGATHAK